MKILNIKSWVPPFYNLSLMRYSGKDIYIAIYLYIFHSPKRFKNIVRLLGEFMDVCVYGVYGCLSLEFVIPPTFGYILCEFGVHDIDLSKCLCRQYMYLNT